MQLSQEICESIIFSITRKAGESTFPSESMTDQQVYKVYNLYIKGTNIVNMSQGLTLVAVEISVPMNKYCTYLSVLGGKQ